MPDYPAEHIPSVVKELREQEELIQLCADAAGDVGRCEIERHLRSEARRIGDRADELEQQAKEAGDE